MNRSGSNTSKTAGVSTNPAGWSAVGDPDRVPVAGKNLAPGLVIRADLAVAVYRRDRLAPRDGARAGRLLPPRPARLRCSHQLGVRRAYSKGLEARQRSCVRKAARSGAGAAIGLSAALDSSLTW